MQTESKEEKLFNIEQMAMMCCWIFDGDYIHTLTNKNDTNREIIRMVKHYSNFPQLNGIESSPPVEQTVDAGQLEKIIGDAFDAGYDFAESGFVSNGPDDIILSDKDQYIKQAIELINNSKTQNHE